MGGYSENGRKSDYFSVRIRGGEEEESPCSILDASGALCNRLCSAPNRPQKAANLSLNLQTNPQPPSRASPSASASLGALNKSRGIIEDLEHFEGTSAEFGFCRFGLRKWWRW